MLMGILGLLCGSIPENFNVTQFKRELYAKLKNPKMDIPQFQQDNTLTFAIY